MKRHFMVGVALLCAACGAKDKAPAAGKAESPEKSKREAGVFVVEPEAQRKAHIVVEQVQQREVTESITAQGQLALNEDRIWRVGAVVGGRVESLPVKLGDAVRRGQILGRIHSHEEHEARGLYQQATIELARAKAEQAYALQRRDRAKRLLELRAGSRQDLENAESELTNAQAAIEKAQSQVFTERTHLTDILHVPLDENAAPGAAEGIPIFAPASGVVYERKSTEGSVVNIGDEVLSIADTSTLWTIASVNEADLSKLRPGQSVQVRVRAYPNREFNGRILKLGEKLDPATRTLQIRVAVPNPQDLLKPEMYATASFEEALHRTALFTAEEAVQDINGVPAVFVRRSSNQFEARTIRAGQRARGQIEILEGLKAQDQIVVKGSFLLKSELLKSTIGAE